MAFVRYLNGNGDTFNPVAYVLVIFLFFAGYFRFATDFEMRQADLTLSSKPASAVYLYGSR